MIGYINSNNQICIGVHGGVYAGDYCSPGNSIKDNEDIKVTFSWDSAHDKFVLKAKGNQTNTEVINDIYMNESTENTIRFGNGDYRDYPEYIMEYPYIFEQPFKNIRV